MIHAGDAMALAVGRVKLRRSATMSVLTIKEYRKWKMQEIRDRREEARRGIAYLRTISPLMWHELDQYLLKKYEKEETEL